MYVVSFFFSDAFNKTMFPFLCILSVFCFCISRSSAKQTWLAYWFMIITKKSNADTILVTWKQKESFEVQGTQIIKLSQSITSIYLQNYFPVNACSNGTDWSNYQKLGLKLEENI